MTGREGQSGLLVQMFRFPRAFEILRTDMLMTASGRHGSRLARSDEMRSETAHTVFSDIRQQLGETGAEEKET